MADLLRIDQVINAAIDCELRKAKLKYGACHRDILTLESRRDDTMDDRELLRALRCLNRTGSRFRLKQGRPGD